MNDIFKKEFYYIRHAETEPFTCSDRCECDIDLSKKGEIQLNLLSEKFKNKSFDYIFSSPMIRCLKTAAAINKSLNIHNTIIIVPELIECGTIPGYTMPDMNYLKKYEKHLIINDIFYIQNENNSDESNYLRAKFVADYISSKVNYGEKALIVSHGSFGNYLIPAMLNFDKKDTIFSLSNTSVSKIKYTSDNKKRLSFLNDISHLRKIDNEYEFNV